MLLQNHLHEEFGTWPLAYIPYGGANFGEVVAVAERGSVEPFVQCGAVLQGEARESIRAF